MKKINTCLTIGTFGIILTALLQIIITLYIPSVTLYAGIYILYSVFIIIMIIGYREIVKEKYWFDML